MAFDRAVSMEGKTTKQCRRCLESLPQTSFAPSAWVRMGSWCRPCTNTYYRGQKRTRPPGYFNKWTKARKERNAGWLAEYKSERGCGECGERHPGCLDFHHRNPCDKLHNIARLALAAHKRDVLMEEIVKCDLLCSNCHRKHHYSEGYKAHWSKEALARHAEYAARAAANPQLIAQENVIRKKRLPRWTHHVIARFQEVS